MLFLCPQTEVMRKELDCGCGFPHILNISQGFNHSFSFQTPATVIQYVKFQKILTDLLFFLSLLNMPRLSPLGVMNKAQKSRDISILVSLNYTSMKSWQLLQPFFFFFLTIIKPQHCSMPQCPFNKYF